MKILLLADIHSNWPALAAIEERFDACLFAGDLVDYGTDPLPCIRWARAQVTAMVRGNHDHAVAHRVPAQAGNGFRSLVAATRPRHWEVLRETDMQFLARMPVTQTVVLDGTSFFLVHGTPRDPLDEYLADDAEAWAARLESIEADFVCVGHTHVPFHLNLGRTQVLNPGSVGQPRDGDPRCSYAVIENGRVEIRRIAYDIEATIRHMRNSRVDEQTLEQAAHTLRTGGGPFSPTFADQPAET
ncbi:MAG: metallophosphoesterase family protein [Planctomycetaceae bacterium]